MKTIRVRPLGSHTPTLAELIAVVSKLTNNQRLCALIVADMINSGRVRLEGSFQNQQVVVG